MVRIRSYQHLMDPDAPTAPLFSRDCLEIDIVVSAQTTLTVYVNHFKSMLGGRDATRERRRRQCAKVKEIVTDRFGANAGDEPFIVLGDFKDYLADVAQGTSGIADLVEWDQVENVVDRLPAADRWTHYWDSGNQYRQLDYALLSRALADANPGAPEIMRKGQPLRATQYTGLRFAGIGEHRPKASDHRPVTMALNLP